VPETLLEIGEYKIHSFKDNILIIDNWYKNYNEMYEIVTNMPLPRWKWKEGSRNFIDYYDCRPVLNMNYNPYEAVSNYYREVKKLVVEHFREEKVLNVKGNFLEFNFYKNINKDVSSNFQHYPHADFDYNCIIYLDKVSSGGTALYRNIEQLVNKEMENLLLDVSKYEKVIIPAKPNRLVIFSGKVYHGGYINNHNDYIDNWRMNQVFFLHPQEE
jgi:hypothetical protein